MIFRRNIVYISMPSAGEPTEKEREALFHQAVKEVISGVSNHFSTLSYGSYYFAECLSCCMGSQSLICKG